MIKVLKDKPPAPPLRSILKKRQDGKGPVGTLVFVGTKTHSGRIRPPPPSPANSKASSKPIKKIFLGLRPDQKQVKFSNLTIRVFQDDSWAPLSQYDRAITDAEIEEKASSSRFEAVPERFPYEKVVAAEVHYENVPKVGPSTKAEVQYVNVPNNVGKGASKSSEVHYENVPKVSKIETESAPKLPPKQLKGESQSHYYENVPKVEVTASAREWVPEVDPEEVHNRKVLEGLVSFI